MWKKIRLGFMLYYRVRLLANLWDDAEVKQHAAAVIQSDPVLAPFLREASQIVEQAKRLL